MLDWFVRQYLRGAALGCLGIYVVFNSRTYLEVANEILTLTEDSWR
jgi:hypothetical protein